MGKPASCLRDRRLAISFITIAVALTFVLLAASPRANALPAFARKYGLRCSTTQTLPGAGNKPCARRSGLDFSYRIRNALTFYSDGFTQHDTFSPLVGPDVAAWLGGIYILRLPGIPKTDFRAEGVYTDPPIGGNVGSGFSYYNQTWISGLTNSGNLMGNWVGREGQGVQAWTSYWFTPRNKLEFEFRHLKVSHEFIPNGGTLADGSVHADFWVRPSCSVSAGVQYEAWTYPVISPTKQSNVTTMVKLSFYNSQGIFAEAFKRVTT